MLIKRYPNGAKLILEDATGKLMFVLPDDRIIEPTEEEAEELFDIVAKAILDQYQGDKQ